MVVLLAQDHPYKHRTAINQLAPPTALGELGVRSLLAPTHVAATTLKNVLWFQFQQDLLAMEPARRSHNAHPALLIPLAHIVLTLHPLVKTGVEQAALQASL